MAVDSRAKRASALNILPTVSINPVADGTTDEFDRMQITWLYAGIEPTGTAPVVITPPAVVVPTPTPVSLGGGPGGRRRKIVVTPNYDNWRRIEDEEIAVI